MSRLLALEVRPEVVAVDVPEARVMNQMQEGRGLLLGLGLGILLIFLASWGNLAIFLRRLQEEERRENHLLEVFGASPAALSRPTTVRGAVVGGGAGLLAAFMFLPWAISLDSFVTGLAGAGALSAAPAAVVALALPLVGILLGGLVGRAGARPRRGDASVGMESLLGWEREVR